MADFIRREDALKVLCNNYAYAAMDVIKRLPAAELHVGDRAWKKAMRILDKKYAEAKKLPFIRDPLAWALYHTWKEFDDGKRCD